jgi:hypothetical protein
MADLSLAKRVELLEAKLALRDLADAYCELVDAREWERLGALFTQDGQFNDVRGRDAIVEHFTAAGAGYSFSFHYVQRIELKELTSTTATAIVVGHAEVQVGDELVVVGPRYADTYAVEDGAWRMSSRRVAYAYRLPYDEYGRRRGLSE